MKKYKLILLFTLLLLALTAFSTAVQAASNGTCGENLTWTLDDAGNLTISGTGAMEDYSYTGSQTGPWGTSIKSVTIENGVTSIGNFAFSGCSGLETITIPDSMTYIGGYPFSGCVSLKSVYITDLSSYLNIYFPDPSSCPMYHAGNLYLNGKRLVNAVIPDGVTQIPAFAFLNCDSIVSVTIPDSVTRIGREAFFGCSSLESVYITDLAAYLNIDSSDSPMYYAEKLYLNGKRLVNAVIPDGVTQIPAYAFYNCDSLSSVTIPDSVTRIGREAFYGCAGLETITIPESVTSIGREAFLNCDKLKNVYIADLTSYLNINFGSSNCSSLMEGRRYLYLNGELLVDVIIPDSVTKIPAYAFKKCDSIKSVTIPGSVNSIGEEAFYYCTGLTRITIENGVRTIGEGAFRFCGNLKTVELPDTITDIEVDAFHITNNILISVKYEGNDVEWTEIYIGSGNDTLKNASISYGYILPVTVIYDANGGQNVPAAQKSDKNVSFTVSTAVPVRTDCKFLGWALEKDAKTAAIQPGSAVSVGEENITLYAVWQNIVSTSTVIARNTIMVTPKNAEPGNTILVACYKNDELVFWELYSYAGETTVPFTPNTAYDTVLATVWNGWLSPLSKAEISH